MPPEKRRSVDTRALTLKFPGTITDQLVQKNASETDKRMAVARGVGILLVRSFKTGEYMPPEELRSQISAIARANSLKEIDLEIVASYLQGVLDQENMNSPLRMHVWGEHSFHEASENVTRQALTTLKASIRLEGPMVASQKKRK